MCIRMYTQMQVHASWWCVHDIFRDNAVHVVVIVVVVRTSSASSASQHKCVNVRVDICGCWHCRTAIQKPAFSHMNFGIYTFFWLFVLFGWQYLNFCPWLCSLEYYGSGTIRSHKQCVLVRMNGPREFRVDGIWSRILAAGTVVRPTNGR